MGGIVHEFLENETPLSPAEKPSARRYGCPPGVREDCVLRPKTFNLSGEGIADDPPGGDGAPSPNPSPDRERREPSAFLKRNLSRPLDGCEPLLDGEGTARALLPQKSLDPVTSFTALRMAVKKRNEESVSYVTKN
jgi:hypothetical protein